MALTRSKAKDLIKAKSKFHQDIFLFKDSDPLILFCNTNLLSKEKFSTLLRFLLNEYQKVATSQSFTTHVCKITLTGGNENDPWLELIPNFKSPRALSDNEVPCTIENFEKFIIRCFSLRLTADQIIQEIIDVLVNFIPLSAPIHKEQSSIPPLGLRIRYPKDQNISGEQSSIVQCSEILESQIDPFEQGSLDPEFQLMHEDDESSSNTQRLDQNNGDSTYEEPAAGRTRPMMDRFVPIPQTVPAPRYGGQENQFLSDFLEDFENYCARNKHVQEEDQAEQLLSVLDGAPRRLATRLHHGPNGMKKYSQLKRELIDVFGKSLTNSQAMMKIENKSKKPGQSWPSYAEELCVLKDKTTPNIEERIVLKKLIGELPRFAKHYVKAKDPRTVIDFLKQVNAYEKEYGVDTTQMGSPREEEQKKVTFAPAQISDSKLDALLEKMNLMTERLDKLEASRQTACEVVPYRRNQQETSRSPSPTPRKTETDQIEALASQIEEMKIFMMQSAGQYRPYRDDYRATSPRFQGRQSRNRYRDDRRGNFSRRSEDRYQPHDGSRVYENSNRRRDFDNRDRQGYRSDYEGSSRNHRGDRDNSGGRNGSQERRSRRREDRRIEYPSRPAIENEPSHSKNA